MLIESIHFKNYKGLRDSVLKLNQLTLLIGPNGSGKSSALNVLKNLITNFSKEDVTAGTLIDETYPGYQIKVTWKSPSKVTAVITKTYFSSQSSGERHEWFHANENPLAKTEITIFHRLLEQVRIFSFNAASIAAPTPLRPEIFLQENGADLPGVLDNLRDSHPERFEALNEELGSWFPEFDRLLFETPERGKRGIKLRTRTGKHEIPAKNLSDGTLIGLAILTLAYLPQPPLLVGIEEPDRGLHPRLLRQVAAAIYRLAYPNEFGDKRDPVQVIVTTHSPYMVDLFREHPENIILANKLEGNVRFERLSDLPNIEEILQDSHLGDLWYSGILGGVPAES
jgi:predicted ATPase